MRGVYRIKRKNGYSVFMTYSVDGKSYRHTVARARSSRRRFEGWPARFWFRG